MDKAPTLPVNTEVDEALAKDPMKVYCMPLEPIATSHPWGGNQFASFMIGSSTENMCIADIEHAEHMRENSSILKRAVRWGSSEYLTHEVTAQEFLASQPVKVELPMGCAGTPGLMQNFSTPKSRGIQQDFDEIQRQCLLRFQHQRKNVSSEEGSTNCSGSDPEPLTNSNYEDDLSSDSEQLPFVKSQSESSPATAPALQPPPGIPSIGSALHGTGMCKPCAWFWKSGSCKNQGSCLHCHLCPQSEGKARKKAKIAMMRLGLATPKSLTTPGKVNKKGTSNFSFCGFHMPDTTADQAVQILDDATKNRTLQNFEELDY